jgi:hypothetical protein
MLVIYMKASASAMFTSGANTRHGGVYRTAFHNQIDQLPAIGENERLSLLRIGFNITLERFDPWYTDYVEKCLATNKPIANNPQVLLRKCCEALGLNPDGTTPTPEPAPGPEPDNSPIRFECPECEEHNAQARGCFVHCLTCSHDWEQCPKCGSTEFCAVFSRDGSDETGQRCASCDVAWDKNGAEIDADEDTLEPAPSPAPTPDNFTQHERELAKTVEEMTSQINALQHQLDHRTVESGDVESVLRQVQHWSKDDVEYLIQRLRDTIEP